jgi:hypothetical protein
VSVAIAKRSARSLTPTLALKKAHHSFDGVRDDGHFFMARKSPDYGASDGEHRSLECILAAQARAPFDKLRAGSAVQCRNLLFLTNRRVGLVPYELGQLGKMLCLITPG